MKIPYLPPSILPYNICILDYDEKLNIILGNLIIDELTSNKDVSLNLVNSRKECISTIKDNKAVLGIVIPNNFTKQTLLHNSSNIELYINGIQQDEMTTALKAFEEAVNNAIEKTFGKKPLKYQKIHLWKRRILYNRLLSPIVPRIYRNVLYIHNFRSTISKRKINRNT